MIKQTNLFNALIEYPECKNLILHNCSGMGRGLKEAEKDPRFGKFITVWLYFNETELAGWAWLFRRRDQGLKRDLSFFVYCVPDFRRSGISEQLFYQARQLAKKRHRRLIVYPWSFKSENFFNKVKVPKKNQLDWVP